MMRLFVCLAVLLVAAQSRGLDFEILNPESAKGRVYFHRSDNSQIGNFPATWSGSGFTVDCSAAPEAAYFDFQSMPPVSLPEFIAADFTVSIFLPVNQPVQALNLRLVDADGEVFQFRNPLPKGEGRWHTLIYTIKADSPQPSAKWGGGDKADGKLTMPVKYRGVTGDYIPGVAGAISLGAISIKVLDSNSPASVELLTGEGSPIHVLRIGEKQNPVLRLTNPRRRQMNAEVTWRLTDPRGRQIANDSRQVLLQPAETIQVQLPEVSMAGVYKLAISVKDSDPAVRLYEKEMRFAYMTPAGPAKERGNGFIFGVCSHPQREPDKQQREAMAAGWCGATALREDVEWFRMQPGENRWTFESFDRVVENYGAYGIEILPILAYGVDWANDKNWKPLKPEFFPRARPDYEHWRKFVQTFTLRYRDRIRYAEVWNEPDLYMFANFPAADYVIMLEIAYDEIKKTAPEWQVLCGGFACLPGQSGKAGNPEMMPAVIRSGKYDIFAFHGHGLFGTYRNQIEKLPSYGNSKPWYANETAVSSMVHGEEIQAQTLFRKLIFSWAQGSMGYNWYCLRNKGFDPANNEHNFGMLTHDFQPKPVYATYNMLALLYSGGTFLREAQAGDNLHGYFFRDRDGAMLLAAWSDAGDGSIAPLLIQGVTGTAESIDLYGNIQALEVKNGSVIFEVEPEPATLRLTGQDREPRIEGALIRPVGDFSITPGEESIFEFELVNPQTDRMGLHLPGGLSSSQHEITLSPGKRQTVRLAVKADREFRSMPNNPEMLEVELDNRRFRYRVTSVVKVPENDYHKLPDFLLNDSALVTSLVPNAPDTAHMFWQGAHDLSAEVRLARSPGELLLQVKVTDDVHCQPYSGGEVWQGDNIQFALKIPGQNGSWEIGLTRLDDGRSEVHIWSAPEGFNSVQIAKSIRLRTGRNGETVYEAGIPLQVIGLTPEIARKGFKFNLLINDNDKHGRESFIAIAPGIGESKDTTLYPTIKF